ncbi:MAG: S1 RNA-binding domain-containing protein, partial [Candidatus Latescibacterota bacterium]|nr:S1 RNA-binding domain-containing protein [Candidatus Latescibacterota bacterium]
PDAEAGAEAAPAASAEAAVPTQPTTDATSTTQVDAPAAQVEESAEQAEEPAAQVDMGKLLEGENVTPGAQIKAGERVSGVLVRVGDENSFVDFGGRSEGILSTSELKGEDGELAFAVGDPLEAFVVSAADEVRLSRFLQGEDREADMLYKAFKSGTPVEGRVMAVNKWGLGVELAGTRAFCPISQIDTSFVQNPEEYRDKTMQFKIIRFRDRGRSIVLSRRALLEVEQEKHATTVRAQVAVDAVLTGTVTRLESFGAFVDLGHGVEGLVHVSEFKHERVGHPQEVVESGQEVKVKVLEIKSLGSRRKERISLSLKALEADPWGEVRAQFPQGSVVNGKIESLESYGAFVELAEGVSGLVHVSEMADKRVNHPRDVVSVGDEVKVAVVELDNRRKRLRLSIRRAEQMEGEANLKEFTDRQQREQEEAGSANSAMLEALKRAQLIG